MQVEKRVIPHYYIRTSKSLDQFMCSIAGIVNFADRDQALRQLEAMNRAMLHRGPDGGGFFADDTAALGHRRLSIIGLATGGQPMGNEDGSIQVVFNGEIYNHLELRARLEARGHVFKTASDTEVLVHLYEECGEDFVPQLAGMFSFALWDSRHRRLFAARDRAGQKPFLYFVHGKKLVFASEFAALESLPDFPGELDPAAIGDFLSLQYIPVEKSVYHEVKKLAPGCQLSFDAASGELKTRRYWTLDFNTKLDCSFDQAAGEVRRLVTEAVRKRLMSEVPSGVFLSGGLDSAIVAALMTELRLPERTAGFTIGFDDHRYDERDGAADMAREINLRSNGAFDHHVKVVDPGNFELVRKLARHYGEPFADGSMLPTHLLASFAREKVTMALSGDAADEVFAGYERYLAMRFAARFGSLRPLFELGAKLVPDRGERTFAGRLRRFSRVAATPAGERYAALLDRCPMELKMRLAGEKLRPHLAPLAGFNRRTATDAVEQFLEIDFDTYLPGDILVKVDIATMASSLEVRNPFLDHQLVEYAASLPLEFKLCGRSRKHILKAAFADLLPAETLAGRKRGFGIPLASWLRGRWRDVAAELLFEGKLAVSGYFQAEVIEELWREHQSGRRDHSYILWNLVILSLFLDRRASSESGDRRRP